MGKRKATPAPSEVALVGQPAWICRFCTFADDGEILLVNAKALDRCERIMVMRVKVRQLPDERRVQL